MQGSKRIVWLSHSTFQKRDGSSGTANLPVWRTYGADLGLGGPRTSRGRPYRGTPGGGTQYAQRAGETVSGIEVTAGDGRSGHKGGAAREEQKGASLIVSGRTIITS
ncbi:hypothetical protein DPMN_053257 [Dreissena polymorpha]|uniref:Uncharacterized protein n=1 Tax=Dreissena polymorpha TaxID=45954 RepID=A0A9D4CNA1_DREPO|nr:hypothetical protein DPMN_053257 [Dreissena polymorpha]